MPKKTTLVSIRFDRAMVEAAGRMESKYDRSNHWILNHWAEVGAATEGVQLFDVDGAAPVKVGNWRHGHGITVGDSVSWEGDLYDVVAVGPVWIGMQSEVGAVVMAQCGDVARVGA